MIIFRDFPQNFLRFWKISTNGARAARVFFQVYFIGKGFFLLKSHLWILQRKAEQVLEKANQLQLAAEDCQSIWKIVIKTCRKCIFGLRTGEWGSQSDCRPVVHLFNLRYKILIGTIKRIEHCWLTFRTAGMIGGFSHLFRHWLKYIENYGFNLHPKIGTIVEWHQWEINANF